MNKLIKTAGFIGNLIIATIILVIIYGNILKAPNNVYFSKGGDGLKSTYGSIYHLKYDDTYLKTDYMNYPYGESVFYTGNQPFIINTFKLLKSTGIDFSDQILGILNVWMLISIVIGSVFLYLILRKLKLPIIYSIIGANIITFLSPQLGRFGGHYNLAYLFFIPLMIYALFRFYESRKMIWSVILAFIALYALGTHAYFFGFYGIMIAIFWVGTFFLKEQDFGSPLRKAIHFTIQLIVPFILFQLLVGVSDHAIDRTSYPWGFFYYKAHPEGVLLPLGKPYAEFLHFKYVKWEGIAYIGLVSLCVFLVGIFQFFKKLSKRNFRKNIFQISDNPFLNILFWASFAALLFSFTMPFNLGLQKLWNYMGPLKQLRAAGRFAWLFFYAINIVSLYVIWNWFLKKRKPLYLLIIVLALSWGSYDAWLNVKGKGKWLNNHIEELDDKANNLPVNKWIQNIHPENYQAIIPLPYFHVGSENYWINGSSKSKQSAFIASMKTGLPLNGVLMSRTSMQQTLNNLQLYYEPCNEYVVKKEWIQDKPFLIVYNTKEAISENEKNLLKYADKIESADYLDIYKIWPAAFDSIIADQKQNINSEINSDSLFVNNQFLTADSAGTYFHKSFGDEFPLQTEMGQKSYNGDIKKYNRIVEAALPNLKDKPECIVSFWIPNMNKDLYPRTSLIISKADSTGNIYKENYTDVWRKIVLLEKNGWGLVEFPVQLNKASDKIIITLKNKLITGGELIVDEILIRPSGTDIYYKGEGFNYKNNRFYYTSK